MKILIIGGTELLCMGIAEKCYKEGHNVVIINSLLKGRIKSRYKYYTFSPSSPECKEVFKANKFDRIIYLDAYAINDNTFGELKNILELSVQYKTGKFLFVSSSEIYGESGNIPIGEESSPSPATERGINILICETYLNQWMSLYGLDTVVFRLTQVYGIDLGINEDSKNLNNIDIIDINDVTEAIYLAMLSDRKGIYNLSSGIKINNGSFMRSDIDNSKIISEFNWFPVHTSEEGIRKIISLFDRADTKRAPETRNRKVKLKSRLIPYMETLILFILLCFITFIAHDSSYMFIDFSVLYIFFCGTINGISQSLVASVLSCSLFIYRYLEYGDIKLLMDDTKSLMYLLMYLFLGMVVGYVIERKNRIIIKRNEIYSDMAKKYDFLNEIHNESLEVNNKLTEQIISGHDSYGKVLSILRKLDHTDPEEVFNSAVLVIENIMKTDKASIYAFNTDMSGAKLICKSKGLKSDLSENINIKDRSDMIKVIESNDIFINRELIPEIPVMTSPIHMGGKIIGAASIHFLELEKLTLYQSNLFKVVTELISYSLKHAYHYKRIKEKGWNTW